GGLTNQGLGNTHRKAGQAIERPREDQREDQESGQEKGRGAMRQAWRWYGPDDPVTLDHVRQAGADEIVTALHQFAPGEAWPRAAVAARKALIENAPGRTPLRWTVVESIPVPDDILLASAGAGRAIDAWIESLRAVAAEDISTICYNV